MSEEFQSVKTESEVDTPECRMVAEQWDHAVATFLDGGSAVPDALRPWAEAYRGRGLGEVTLEAFPEPFLGPLTKPRGIFLALNPGRADLAFQGRDSIFATEIRRLGGYSAWATTWPYLRDPWVCAKGVNRHHSSRLRFLQRWFDGQTISAADMVGFELFPWHSTRVTARIAPDPEVIREFIWKPIGELHAPVFAFGAPWFPLLDGLGLKLVDCLGVGGRSYATDVPSRRVAVFKDPNGITVIAETHSGSAGPPSLHETQRLKDAIERWL